MEKDLKIGAFEVLDQDQMTEVNGGDVVGIIVGLLVSYVVDGVCKATFGSAPSDWIAEGIRNYQPDMQALQRTRLYQVYGQH